MSRILEAVFDTALDLYNIDLMDEEKFHEFVELCQSNDISDFVQVEDIVDIAPKPNHLV